MSRGNHSYKFSLVETLYSWALTTVALFFDALSKLFLKTWMKLEQAHYRAKAIGIKILDTRDIALFKSIFKRYKSGSITATEDREIWSGLSSSSLVKFLKKEAKCILIAEIDYNDMVSYHAYYNCPKYNRIVKVYIRTKISTSMYIEWAPSTLENLRKLAEEITREIRESDAIKRIY